MMRYSINDIKYDDYLFEDSLNRVSTFYWERHITKFEAIVFACLFFFSLHWEGLTTVTSSLIYDWVVNCMMFHL